MAGAGLFWEKSTVSWLLVAGLFWEKSTAGWWLISQANKADSALNNVLATILATNKTSGRSLPASVA
jgi:hypothetical protein